MSRPPGFGRAKKSLGQNFLVDANLQHKIVRALEAGPDDEVLEIGPGRGALTRHLVDHVGRLVLVELDDDLAAALQERFGAREDVRRRRIGVAAREFGHPQRVVAESFEAPRKLFQFFDDESIGIGDQARAVFHEVGLR